MHDRKTGTSGDEANDDLWLHLLVVPGEAWLLKIVLPEGFEVQGGDIVQYQAELLLQLSSSSLDGCGFCLLLMLQELRKQAIEGSLRIGDLDLAKSPARIFGRRRAAHCGQTDG